MSILNLLYYLLVLIREGHIAQYQNMNGTNKPPYTWFSLPQIIFLVISALYVYYNEEGLSNNVIDYILSALSIMTALFMSLIVVVLDKMKTIRFKNEDGKSNIQQLHLWNYMHQFSSITSYATLLAILLISILVGTLLFAHPTNLHNYSFVKIDEIDFKSLCLFVKLSITVVIRFSFCYFLLDFLLMTLYAVTLIFQSIFSELNTNKPNIPINKEEPITDSLNKEFGKLSYLTCLILLFIVLGLFIYYVVN